MIILSSFLLLSTHIMPTSAISWDVIIYSRSYAGMDPVWSDIQEIQWKDIALIAAKPYIDPNAQAVVSDPFKIRTTTYAKQSMQIVGSTTTGFSVQITVKQGPEVKLQIFGFKLVKAGGSFEAGTGIDVSTTDGYSIALGSSNQITMYANQTEEIYIIGSGNAVQAIAYAMKWAVYKQIWRYTEINGRLYRRLISTTFDHYEYDGGEVRIRKFDSIGIDIAFDVDNAQGSPALDQQTETWLRNIYNNAIEGVTNGHARFRKSTQSSFQVGERLKSLTIFYNGGADRTDSWFSEHEQFTRSTQRVTISGKATADIGFLGYDVEVTISGEGWVEKETSVTSSYYLEMGYTFLGNALSDTVKIEYFIIGPGAFLRILPYTQSNYNYNIVPSQSFDGIKGDTFRGIFVS